MFWNTEHDAQAASHTMISGQGFTGGLRSRYGVCRRRITNLDDDKIDSIRDMNEKNARPPICDNQPLYAKEPGRQQCYTTKGTLSRWKQGPFMTLAFHYSTLNYLSPQIVAHLFHLRILSQEVDSFESPLHCLHQSDGACNSPENLHR